MSELSVFSFSEKLPVRVVEINAEPWFVARDIAQCLEYSRASIEQPKNLFKSVPDQWKGMQEFDTNGGKQKLLALSEQGLYFFLGRSDKPKALPFQMWLAGEVIPQIRKTGRYEPESPKYITTQQSWIIQAAVQKRVHREGVDFQTVYQALKARYQIPKYTFLQEKDFEEALRFIDACEIRVPAKKAKLQSIPKPEPMLPPPQLSDEDLESLLIFIYTVRYLFADSFNKFYEFLKASKSPLAAECWDAFHEVSWGRILDILAANGHDIRDMHCYRNWRAQRAA